MATPPNAEQDPKKDARLDEFCEAVEASQAKSKNIPVETFEVRGDEAVYSNILDRRVMSLEDLIQVCSIDEKVWYIKEWSCNKWEMGSMPRATRTSGSDAWVRPKGAPSATQLFQVKATMIRVEVHKLNGPAGKAEFLRQLKLITSDDSFKFPPRLPQVFNPIDLEQHEIAAGLVSDWHLTETVRPEDANGVNFYNSMVCANRAWAHAQKFKSILARHMSLYTIDHIWLAILGDMISGTIHDEYLATNDLPDAAATILCARLIAMFVTEIASMGLRVVVDAVHGNHPRTTPKVPTKRQALTNMDWVIYEMVSDLVCPLDNVEFNITTAQIGCRKLYDWTYRFEHGMNVGSGKEEDFEDRLRALFDDAVYRQATGHQGPAFDQIVIGNMHKPKFLERTIVNGSLIGQNELGQGWRLKPIRAQQLMWGISQHYPRTWQYQVDLTNIKHEGVDNPMAEYARWFLDKHGKR